MAGAFRHSIRKLLVVTLAVRCLGVGYLVRGVDGSAGRPAVEAVPEKKLTASDLMLAASTANEIHLRYQGVTSGVVNADHLNEIPADSLQFGVARAISPPGPGGRNVGAPSISEITQMGILAASLSTKSISAASPLVAASRTI